METKYFKVTVETYYALEYYNKENLKDDISVINGSSSEQVKKEWFEDYPIDRNHATRDAYKIGNSAKIKSIELMDKI